MIILYQTENKTRMINLDDLLEKYFDREKFLGLCKKCRNYGNLWSCPPYDFNIIEYLIQYNHVYLIGTKITFSQKTIDKINTQKKIHSFTDKTLRNERAKIRNVLLEIENDNDNSVSLYAGSCLLCKKCNRINHTHCRNINKMRYSLESLGFDVSGISNNLLDIELKWSSDSLPEYFTLVSAVLSKDKFDFDSYF